MNMDCFICRKLAGEEAAPPGGMVWRDEQWHVGHAPLPDAVPGTLIVESVRHFLDFADMTDEDAAAFGFLMRRLYQVLKEVTGAERVYTLVLLEGVPHFHVWLIPRRPTDPKRSLTHISATYDSTLTEVLPLVETIREQLGRRVGEAGIKVDDSG